MRRVNLVSERAWWLVARRATGLATALALVACFVAVAGCKRSPRVVPVSGRVLYNSKPLPFGVVMFQPDKGQTASGDIQSDGSFKLSSYAPDDGAVPGRHVVSVTCYEGQRPGGGKPKAEGSMGKLLIPLKYARFGSSGLTADVKDAPEQTIEINLEGPPAKF